MTRLWADGADVDVLAVQDVLEHRDRAVVINNVEVVGVVVEDWERREARKSARELKPSGGWTRPCGAGPKSRPDDYHVLNSGMVVPCDPRTKRAEEPLFTSGSRGDICARV